MLYLHLYYFFKLSELGVLILKLNQDSSFIYVKDVKLGRIVHVESIRKELTKLLWLLLYHNKQTMLAILWCARLLAYHLIMSCSVWSGSIAQVYCACANK